MQFQRHVDKWWFEPEIAPVRVRIPASLMRTDPTADGAVLPKPKRITTGAFKPKRLRKPYNRLQPLSAGYIVPLYTLSDIATRYGLSQNSTRYFRSHILPEPFDLVRRRSVNAHHWSRFTLMVLDVVLDDLEKRGRLQFLASYSDHVRLLHTGVEFLHNYYSDMDYVEPLSENPFGVSWVDS